jgi:adenine-specific DNA methylase
MPAFLASRLIDQYSNKGEMIFDPFCGSGSVLTEALRLNRKCIGSDLLDFSILIAQTAVNLPEPGEIAKYWNTTRKNALDNVSLFSQPNLINPLDVNTQELSKWLHPETLAGVLSIRNQVNINSTNRCEHVVALILAGSLPSLSKRVSRGILHWGWIADNVLPKPNDLYIVDPFVEVDRRIKKLINFISATGNLSKNKALSCAIKNINWLKYDNEFGDSKADLLITSPPYPYSIDYTLAQRLTHYLFSKEFKSIKSSEIGARFKRKRKNRQQEYLDELRISLDACSKHVVAGGKAIFVLPHPDEYKNILTLSECEWLDFINNSLNGNWKVEEYGVRDCNQRRVVNASVANRRELIMVSSKEE